MACTDYAVSRFQDFTALPHIERIKACGRLYWERYHVSPNVCYVPPGLDVPETIGPMRVLRDRQLQPHEIDLGREIQSTDAAMAAVPPVEPPYAVVAGSLRITPPQVVSIPVVDGVIIIGGDAAPATADPAEIGEAKREGE